jgi:RHS repeat-associated protein
MLGYEVHSCYPENVTLRAQEGNCFSSAYKKSSDYANAFLWNYPFGLKMPGLSYIANGADENKFTYNGKELEDEFGLDWYHYGLRFYDPAVGRWWGVDKIDEFVSPYLAMSNNPIIFIDKDGLDAVIVNSSLGGDLQSL